MMPLAYSQSKNAPPSLWRDGAELLVCQRAKG